MPSAQGKGANWVGWLSSPCLTNQERGTERAPRLPKVTPGGNDTLGLGPWLPALTAQPESSLGPTGRRELGQGQPATLGALMGDRLLLRREPTPAFNTSLCPFLSGRCPGTITPPTTVWRGPHRMRGQDRETEAAFPRRHSYGRSRRQLF